MEHRHPKKSACVPDATYQVSLKETHWFQEAFNGSLPYTDIVFTIYRNSGFLWYVINIILVNVNFLVPESLHTQSE